jgi:CHAT domain-containing protein
MIRNITLVAVLLLASPALAQIPTAQSLLSQGRDSAADGNYAAAEAAHRSALEIQTRQASNSAAMGEILLELALQVSNQSRFDEASALFRRAEPIIDAAAVPGLRARAALYRAMDAANRRDYVTAMRFARDAVAARRADVTRARTAGVDAAGNPPMVPAALSGELARALKLQAELALRLDDLPGAQGAAEEALYILTDQQELPLAWRPQMISLMGAISSRQGRTAVAEKQFVQALEIDKKLFGENSSVTIAAQLQLGAFYAGEQVYDAAITTYRQAFSGLDKNAAARAAITADQIIPFLQAATSVKASPALDTAMFAASQLVGGGVESQTIARVAARRAAGNAALGAQVRAAEDAARAESTLRAQLAAEHARSDEEREPGREKALADALPAATEKSASLAAKLRSDFPDYARLAAPAPVALGTLQKALRPREAFVSYLLGVHNSYVLLVSSSGFTAAAMGAGQPEIAAQVVALRGTLTPRLGKLPDFNTAAAHALYKMALAPVEAQLAGVDHLLVSASGDLSSIPFGLLLTADVHGSRDYAHAPWLVRQRAVASVPSASAFLTLRAAPAAPAPRPVLLVGNPSFEGTANTRALDALAASCQSGGPVNIDLVRAMPPLPETAAEMQAVARDLKASPDDLLTGAGASESGLRAKPLDQYAVLYFATHGLLPGELHCQAEPGLVLSPPVSATASTDTDGLLTASEISELRLNAALVVLSACNTAASGGTGYGGSALEGLAAAFFNAGAHAVLATHWEVPSAPTTALMIALFDARSQNGGRDSAQALRQAQLAAINRPGTAHPFAWAAFALIGDGE